MYFRDACIPVRLGWSSPFARWQGPLAELSSIDVARCGSGDGVLTCVPTGATAHAVLFIASLRRV